MGNVTWMNVPSGRSTQLERVAEAGSEQFVWPEIPKQQSLYKSVVAEAYSHVRTHESTTHHGCRVLGSMPIATRDRETSGPNNVRPGFPRDLVANDTKETERHLNRHEDIVKYEGVWNAGTRPGVGARIRARLPVFVLLPPGPWRLPHQGRPVRQDAYKWATP